MNEKQACVVSDLHMFCRRSQWEQYLEAIEEAIQDTDLFVFNGDTFDFKWTMLQSIEDTVEEAIMFLRRLANDRPDCQFHVNLGNHDHFLPFINALNDLCEEVENMSWHPYYLRIGDTLFIHGDAAMWDMKQVDLERYRSQWLHHKKQGRIKNRVYDAAFNARAHVAISRIAFPHRLTLRRLYSYIDHIGHGFDHGVKRVYFGHTHVPVKGHQYRGVEFHNGGAPMKHMKFNLLKTKVIAA
jgi:UDP-2,3-diacylglucosamine hydrolase